MRSVFLLLSALTRPVFSTHSLRRPSALPPPCISRVSAFSDTLTQLSICETCSLALPQVTLTSEEFTQYRNDESFRSRVDACLRPDFTAVSITVPAAISNDLDSFDEFSNFFLWSMLTSLRIQGDNYIRDISALSLAPNLRELTFLDDTESLADISVLSELPALEVLRISEAAITDFSVLASLSSLTTLSLKGTLISDFSVFQHLPALTSLELPWATRMSDLSFLRDLCPRLVRLDVSETEISDLSPLAEFCPNLKHLDISYTPVSEISALATLTQLESLRLDRMDGNLSRQIPNVLSQLGNLRSVSLFRSKISDVSFLLPSKGTLEELNLGECSKLKVKTLTEVLREFKQLRVLNLGAIEDLVDVAFLEELGNLEELSIRSTRVHDISAISGLKKLRSLDIGNTRIEELTAIGELTELEIFKASNIAGEFSCVEPLEKLVKLRELKLNDNVELRDISSLVGLVLLETLDLGMTQVDDVRVLAKLPNLKTLSVPDGYPRGIKGLGVLEKLESVRLGESECFESGEEFRQYLEDYREDEDEEEEDVEEDD